MTEQMNEERTVGAMVDVDERRRTLPDRLAKAVGLNDCEVRIVAGYTTANYNGKRAMLRTVDVDDPGMTFKVDLFEEDGTPADRHMWVYEIEPLPVDFGSLMLPPDTLDEWAWLAEHPKKKDQIEALKARLTAVSDDLLRTAEHRDRLIANAEENDRIVRAVRGEFEQFKQQVREVAIRTAEQENWCDDGLNEVLDELGLDRKEPPRWEVTFKVVKTFEVTAYRESDDEPDEEFVVASLSSDYRGLPEMDSDWDDVDVCETDDVKIQDVQIEKVED